MERTRRWSSCSALSDLLSGKFTGGTGKKSDCGGRNRRFYSHSECSTSLKASSSVDDGTDGASGEIKIPASPLCLEERNIGRETSNLSLIYWFDLGLKNPRVCFPDGLHLSILRQKTLHWTQEELHAFLDRPVYDLEYQDEEILRVPLHWDTPFLRENAKRRDEIYQATISPNEPFQETLRVAIWGRSVLDTYHSQSITISRFRRPGMVELVDHAEYQHEQTTVMFFRVRLAMDPTPLAEKCCMRVYQRLNESEPWSVAIPETVLPVPQYFRVNDRYRNSLSSASAVEMAFYYHLTGVVNGNWVRVEIWRETYYGWQRSINYTVQTPRAYRGAGPDSPSGSETGCQCAHCRASVLLTNADPLKSLEEMIPVTDKFHTSALATEAVETCLVPIDCLHLQHPSCLIQEGDGVCNRCHNRVAGFVRAVRILRL